MYPPQSGSIRGLFFDSSSIPHPKWLKLIYLDLFWPKLSIISPKLGKIKLLKFLGFWGFLCYLGFNFWIFVNMDLCWCRFCYISHIKATKKLGLYSILFFCHVWGLYLYGSCCTSHKWLKLTSGGCDWPVLTIFDEVKEKKASYRSTLRWIKMTDQ